MVYQKFKSEKYLFYQQCTKLEIIDTRKDFNVVFISLSCMCLTDKMSIQCLQYLNRNIKISKM